MKFEHLRNVLKSFELAVKALPQPLRNQSATAYLLCRVLDTIEDTPQANPTECFEVFLVSFAAQTPPPHFTFGNKEEKKLLELLSDLHKEFFTYPEKVQTIMLNCFSEMAYGMNKFHGRSIQSIVELDIYCHFVAGTFANMLTKLFANYLHLDQAWIDSQLPHAHEFALGIQKLNILKDWDEDKKQGRIFLPDSLGKEELKYTILVHLENAQNYIYELPRDPAAIRLFGLWPLCSAILTVNHFPKLNQHVMHEMMEATTLKVHSNKQLQEYLAALLRHAHSRSKNPLNPNMHL